MKLIIVSTVVSIASILNITSSNIEKDCYESGDCINDERMKCLNSLQYCLDEVESWDVVLPSILGGEMLRNALIQGCGMGYINCLNAVECNPMESN